MKKVLCIDDDKVTLMIYKKLLTKIEGVSVVTAENGAEALDKIATTEVNEHPHIILLDINMPVMNAWGFLKKYESEYQHKMQQTKIFVVSSTVDPNDKKMALSFHSVSGFVPKPITMENISSLII